METEEMKQKNEEILAKWRNLGLLSGLKEGSINEWRCAKSFDDIAKYIMDNNLESYSLTVFAFPFIRRVLCTGKERLSRILSPEEVCNFLSNVTVKECIERAKTKSESQIRKTLITLIENFLSYTCTENETLIEFCDEIKTQTNEQKNMFLALMDGIFDFEPVLLASATDIFVKKVKEG